MGYGDGLHLATTAFIRRSERREPRGSGGLGPLAESYTKARAWEIETHILRNTPTSHVRTTGCGNGLDITSIYVCVKEIP